MGDGGWGVRCASFSHSPSTPNDAMAFLHILECLPDQTWFLRVSRSSLFESPTGHRCSLLPALSPVRLTQPRVSASLHAARCTLTLLLLLPRRPSPDADADANPNGAVGPHPHLTALCPSIASSVIVSSAFASPTQPAWCPGALRAERASGPARRHLHSPLGQANPSIPQTKALITHTKACGCSAGPSRSIPSAHRRVSLLEQQ